MNRTIGQLAPGDPAGLSGGVPVPQASPKGNAEQRHFRIDLRRSLQMHRKLALGFGLLGFVLAAAYLVMFWSGYTAQDLINIQPTPFAGFEGAASIAMLLVVVFGGLGLLAAVAAHKLDQRIYTAAEVEQLLGLAPMATLPDFSEVQVAVAGEYLQRLASAIECAFKEGSQKTCIFMGTGPRVGVTTIAGRLRAALDARAGGKHVGGGTSRAAAGHSMGSGDDAAEENARAMALLRSVVGEAEGEQRELVVSEAAPITASTENDYLVRFADCTIVVIESGVTTRAQLRTTVHNLRRLNPAQLRFVLNRVSLRNADPAFRSAIKEMERRLYQSRSEERALAGAQVAGESTRAETRAADAAQTAKEPAVREQEEGHELPPQFDPYLRELQHELPPVTNYEEWLAATAARSETARTQPRAGNDRNIHVLASNRDRNEAAREAEKLAQEAENVAQKKPEHFELPKLSGLRGRLFALGIRELDLARHSDRHQAESEFLMKQIEPLASIFEGTGFGGAGAAGNFVPGAEAQAGPEKARPMLAARPAPETNTASGATNDEGVRADELPKITSEPEILFPNLVSPKKSKMRGSGYESVDDVQILPSKKGQYRRKDQD